jgi:hypothetical protein
MHIIRLLAVLMLLPSCAGFITRSHADEPPSASKIGTLAGVLKASNADEGTITLGLPAPFHDRKLTVADPAAKHLLGQAAVGDVVKFTADDTTKPTRLDKLNEIRRPVGIMPRVIALAASAALICLLAAAMVGRSPSAFLVGVDNRYSNSQVQLALWFGAVATVYAATTALRLLYLGTGYLGGVEITENLMTLTGLSALSFGGAKVITSQKVQNAAQAAGPPPKPAAAQPRLLSDLVQNDSEQADLGDFQMILVALAAVVIFVLSGFYFLGALELSTNVTLPDVDSTLLASFGIGQGAYLVKKAALKAGDG